MQKGLRVITLQGAIEKINDCSDETKKMDLEVLDKLRGNLIAIFFKSEKDKYFAIFGRELTIKRAVKKRSKEN